MPKCAVLILFYEHRAFGRFLRGEAGGGAVRGAGGRPDGPCPGRAFDGPLALDRRAATRFTGNFVARDVRYMST